MLLPNFSKALIGQSKITEYLFSNNHPIGRHKAIFFKRYGFDSSSIEFFVTQIQNLIATNQCREIIDNEFGTKYIVEGIIYTPNETQIELVTVWFIEKGGLVPYFVTAYPKRN